MGPVNTIKQFAKHKSTFHQPNGERNIFLFSMPRSGTTWLMEMIASQPGFKVVNEPFNLRKEVVKENLGLETWESFFLPENQPKVDRYIRNFITGNDTDLRFRRYAPFSEFWRLRTSRIIFKILFLGEHNISWYTEQFNGQAVYLVRHPIPVSLSREVHPRLRSFLDSPFRDHFSHEELAYAQSIAQAGDPYACAVLDWCFQNVMALRNRPKDMLLVTYEQMVLEPETVIQHLVQQFQFTRPDLMFNRLDKASGSTGKSDKESQAVLKDRTKIKENKEWLIKKWKKKITPAQEAITFEILDAFGIDIYQSGRFIPSDSYLLPQLS